MNININSLLPKIHEPQYIAKLSEAAIIGISESKLDDLGKFKKYRQDCEHSSSQLLFYHQISFY